MTLTAKATPALQNNFSRRSWIQGAKFACHMARAVF
jgi:hypothetical protein